MRTTETRETVKGPPGTERRIARYRRSSFARLAAMSARDMLRNRLTGFASLFVFGWLLLLYVVLDAMISGGDGEDPEMMRAALPSVLMCGIAALALMGTTVPLVAQRERGMLRLLGTTPLSRSTFLLAQLPARLALIAVQLVVVAAIAALYGYFDASRAPRMILTVLLGSLLCFAFALLFAARSRSAESSHHTMAFVAVSLMFVSGGFLPTPPGGFPAPVELAMHALPSAWFAAALGADLVGSAPPVPVPLLWLLMALVGLAAGALALRRFAWDHTDPVIPVPSSTSDPAPAETQVTR